MDIFEPSIDGLALVAEAADLVGELVGGPVGMADEVDALILGGLEAPQFALQFPPHRLGH
ncbi:hypothetical protein [Glycomyces xiaoerkulensis]|uniref:hypothetical protein n=1 Tax=Glycomyces xiaoerkulensis TaxID=2038139 RepID=UPI001E39183F|nr:hypothetical protein [Glycomyces xiaoerkulensis]